MKYSSSFRFSNETGVWSKEKPAQLGPGVMGGKREKKGRRENRSTCSVYPLQSSAQKGSINETSGSDTEGIHSSFGMMRRESLTATAVKSKAGGSGWSVTKRHWGSVITSPLIPTRHRQDPEMAGNLARVLREGIPRVRHNGLDENCSSDSWHLAEGELQSDLQGVYRPRGAQVKVKESGPGRETGLWRTSATPSSQGYQMSKPQPGRKKDIVPETQKADHIIPKFSKPCPPTWHYATHISTPICSAAILERSCSCKELKSESLSILSVGTACINCRNRWNLK